MYFPNNINGERSLTVNDLINDFGSIFEAPQRLIERCGAAFRLDIKEDPESYTIYADLPGVAKEQIEAVMDGSTLTVTVKEAAAAAGQKETRTVHRERVTYCGTREVELPLATGQQVDASLKDGVLMIEVKKDEAKKARKIQIS